MNSVSQDLSKKFLKFFSANNLLKDVGGNFAVGVSGGPDSMALISLLSHWASENDDTLQIHALIVNHGLRKEAKDEAEQVKKWLTEWSNVHPEILNRSIAKEELNKRVQERAREDRYQLLSEYCEHQQIQYLFLAHHSDDQAETFLFRLAKGSGLDGLCAMSEVSTYSERLKILRPLLSSQKDDLILYCNEQNIPFVNDPSNYNKKFARPRLRQAKDVLEAEGLSSKRLFLTAQRLNRAKRALDYYSEIAFSSSVINHSDNEIILDFNHLISEPEEIRIRVIQQCIKILTPLNQPYGPRMEKIESLSKDLFYNLAFKPRTLGGLVFKVADKGTKIKIYRE